MLFWIKVFNAEEYEWSENNVGVYVKNKTTGEEIFIYDGFVINDLYDDDLNSYDVNIFSSTPHFVIVAHT